METGEVQLQYAATSGRRRRIGPTRTEPQQASGLLRERVALVTTGPTGTAASWRRARTITYTREETAMCIARIQAETGRNMRMVVGRTRVRSRRRTPRVRTRREGAGPSSNPVKAEGTGLPLDNSQRPLQALFSSWIETRKLGKEEPSGRNSSSDMKADLGPGVPEELHAGGISKRATQARFRMRRMPRI